MYNPDISQTSTRFATDAAYTSPLSPPSNCGKLECAINQPGRSRPSLVFRVLSWTPVMRHGQPSVLPLRQRPAPLTIPRSAMTPYLRPSPCHLGRMPNSPRLPSPRPAAWLCKDRPHAPQWPLASGQGPSTGSDGNLVKSEPTDSSKPPVPGSSCRKIPSPTTSSLQDATAIASSAACVLYVLQELT